MMDHLIDNRSPITSADIDQAIADARSFLAGQPIPARDLIERLAAIVADAYGDPYAEENEPEPDDYDPGPEVDDEGGMSEYRHASHEPEPWS